MRSNKLALRLGKLDGFAHFIAIINTLIESLRANNLPTDSEIEVIRVYYKGEPKECLHFFCGKTPMLFLWSNEIGYYLNGKTETISTKRGSVLLNRLVNEFRYSDMKSLECLSHILPSRRQVIIDEILADLA